MSQTPRLQSHPGQNRTNNIYYKTRQSALTFDVYHEIINDRKHKVGALLLLYFDLDLPSRSSKGHFKHLTNIGPLPCTIRSLKVHFGKKVEF